MAVFLSKHFDFWTLARCDSWAEEVVCLGKMSFLCMCKRVLHVHVLMIQNNMALHPLSCFWVSVPSLPYHHISVYSALALTHIPLPVPYTDWEVGVEEGEKMTNEDLKQKKTKNQIGQLSSDSATSKWLTELCFCSNKAECGFNSPLCDLDLNMQLCRSRTSALVPVYLFICAVPCLRAVLLIPKDFSNCWHLGL